MKKALVPLIVLVVVGIVVAFAIMPSTPAATEKLKAEISQQLQSGKTVFLQLSSTGCVTCRKMKPEIEKLIAELNGKSDFSIINVDVDSHASLASQFAVSGVPTQVVLSPKGEELFRNMGYMSADNIKYVLNSATNK